MAKYQAIALELAARIRDGQLTDKGRLPGEVDLAEEFDVSRGTIRQALATLKQQGLIETTVGSGSYVTYDGMPIVASLGWARSFERQGVVTSVRSTAIGRMSLPDLAEELGLNVADFLVIDRVRVKEDGEPISLERSRLPWREAYAAILADGLVSGSIMATLASLGVVRVSGHEVIRVAMLGSDEAKLLGTDPGDTFLEYQQTAYTAAGEVVERVSSLLHPRHFQLEYQFGPSSPNRGA